MREVEKIPEFADEVAEVSTTAFTTCAAMAIPARLNMVTKGLFAGSISFQGFTMRITRSAPT